MRCCGRMLSAPTDAQRSGPRRRGGNLPPVAGLGAALSGGFFVADEVRNVARFPRVGMLLGMTERGRCCEDGAAG